MASIRTPILSRRLVSLRPLPKGLPFRVQIRYASLAREVTEDDIQSFHAFLETHPNEAQLEAFKQTRKFKDIAKHLQDEGATQDEIDTMTQPLLDDPGMNGGYVNPPGLKRGLRDPYEDWWDKQERRNYGEPVHEDHDILGVFALEEYNQWGPGKAGRYFLGYFTAIAALAGVVYTFGYPQKPSVARSFPNGLETELGGKGAVLAPVDE